MTDDQARDLAHNILCIFAEAHIKEGLAKPFIIDMAAHNILEAFKLYRTSDGMREVLKKLIFSNIRKDEEEPYTYYIFYGIYRIVFKGHPDSTLAEMNKYFLSKIENIADGKYD
jgi:hypothetical protein